MMLPFDPSKSARLIAFVCHKVSFVKITALLSYNLIISLSVCFNFQYGGV